MTTELMKNKMFSAYKIEEDKGKEDNEKALAKLISTDSIAVFVAFNNAAEQAGFGGIKINSGYRSSEKQLELYNNACAAGKGKGQNGKDITIPSTAAPKSSAHEWGSAIDCVPVKGLFDAFIRWAAEWFFYNNKKVIIDNSKTISEMVDQFIDESDNNNRVNGWLHIGLTHGSKKDEHRQLYCAFWGNDHNTFKGPYAVKSYLEWRTKKMNSLGLAVPSSYTILGANGGVTIIKNETVSTYNAESAKLSATYITNAATLAELNALMAINDEYQTLINNAGTYRVFTEEELTKAEADIDDPGKVINATSPAADQEVQLKSNLSSSTNSTSGINIIELTNAANNINELSVDNQTPTELVHTRIYEKFKATIKLDEMSLSTEGESSKVDDNTNLHYDQYGNNGSTPPPSVLGDAHATNYIKAIGSVAPLIRINDVYYSGAYIVKFNLYTLDFIPTIYLELQTLNNDILESNTIKAGDICSVFINPDNNILKSYRGDFIITGSVTHEKKFKECNTGVHISIAGELYIPKLYDNTMTFSKNGTSQEVLELIATDAGLGFFFCDDESPNDVQVWTCTTSAQLKENNSSPIIDFIKNTTAHAYKNENAFYDSWIDPRYGLTFLNINKMLGEDGLDENVDIAFVLNAMTNDIAAHGDNLDGSAEQKQTSVMPKIFNNITGDPMSMTNFFVYSFKETNNNKITDEIGLYNKQVYNIKNPGLTSKNNKIEFNAALCINKTKLLHGFTIFGGPGKNDYYVQADNGDYGRLHTSVSGGTISSTLSDIDSKIILETGSNMQSSGNNHKFYKIAPTHNALNNLLLMKKQIEIKINGVNLLIMRGERIPMLLMSNGIYTSISSAIKANPNNTVVNQTYELGSGWFIISGIAWSYDGNKKEGGSSWYTSVILTRREWPIPGWVEIDEEDDKNAIKILNTINDTSVIEGKTDSSVSGSGNGVTNDSDDEYDDCTTEGLTKELKGLWIVIKDSLQKDGKAAKIVGARRWAADEEGNRVLDREPYIQDGDSYKMVNSNDEVMWFSDKYSPHLYGTAIDIINESGTDYSAMIETLVKDPNVLGYLLLNGIYGVAEISRDDTGNVSKHFHFGKPSGTNTGDLTKFWNWIIKINGNTISYNGKIYDLNTYLQYNDLTRTDDVISIDNVNESFNEDQWKTEHNYDYYYESYMQRISKLLYDDPYEWGIVDANYNGNYQMTEGGEYRLLPGQGSAEDNVVRLAGTGFNYTEVQSNALTNLLPVIVLTDLGKNELDILDDESQANANKTLNRLQQYIRVATDEAIDAWKVMDDLNKAKAGGQPVTSVMTKSYKRLPNADYLYADVDGEDELSKIAVIDTNTQINKWKEENKYDEIYDAYLEEFEALIADDPEEYGCVDLSDTTGFDDEYTFGLSMNSFVDVVDNRESNKNPSVKLSSSGLKFVSDKLKDLEQIDEINNAVKRLNMYSSTVTKSSLACWDLMAKLTVKFGNI